MYAIIKTGGNQYKVREGEIIFVEKIDNEADEKVVFEDVLFVENDGKASFGTPFVKGASVEGKVLSQGKAKKIIVFKYRPKKGSATKQGHRQPYTKVQIEKINA